MDDLHFRQNCLYFVGMQKDFSSVSPSAKSLLLSKAHTNIPFAREAAELISQPDHFTPDFNNSDFLFWMRVIHFEDRYFSINELLKDISTNNIMELSSGFSFRGLDMVARQENLHYIDTDLPGLIDTKKKLFANLRPQFASNSMLEILPLNVLDESAFLETVSRFKEGPITILNEGLLMYLEEDEKKQLLKIIHDILKQRGGYWITADIYIKTEFKTESVMPKDELSQLVAEHKIDEKKFESFEHAAEFFKESGFVIDKTIEPVYPSHSSFQYLLKTLPAEVRDSGKPPPKFRETWRLKVAD
jgi:O-methyltransferase involved in polyketide biosynthesis